MPETAGFGGGKGGKISLGGSLLPSGSYLKTQEVRLIAGLNRNYFPRLGVGGELGNGTTAQTHQHSPTTAAGS